MIRSAIQFLITLYLPVVLILGACQSDTEPEAREGAPVSDTPPKLEKSGPKTLFRVLDAKGEAVKMVKIFERVSPSSGSVYQFSNGDGQFDFEAGPIYKIRAEGYHDLEFTIEGQDQLPRILFYLWKEAAAHEGLSVSGYTKADNFRVFPGVQVSCGGETITTAADGAYFLTPVLGEEDKEVPVTFTWPRTATETGTLTVTLREKPDFPVRLEVFLQTDQVLPPKQKKD